MKKRRSRIWKVSSEEFKNIVKNANSFSDIARHFNYSTNSSVFAMIKERMEAENLDLRALDEARKVFYSEHAKKVNSKKEKTPLTELLVEHSTYNSTYELKKKLIKEGLIQEKCENCGIGPEWQGEKLSLQLDHKNGVNDDNRLENLRLLCPNCHSQTPTFSGKRHKIIKKCFDCGILIHRKSSRCQKCANKFNGLKMIGANNPACKVLNRLSRIELIQLILEKPFLQIGKQYGVSDTAVRKWCKAENLPFRKKDINDMREELERELTEALISTQ